LQATLKAKAVGKQTSSKATPNVGKKTVPLVSK